MFTTVYWTKYLYGHKYTKLPGYFMHIFSLIESIFDCFASPSFLVTVNDFDRWILFLYLFLSQNKNIYVKMMHCNEDRLMITETKSVKSVDVKNVCIVSKTHFLDANNDGHKSFLSRLKTLILWFLILLLDIW